MPLAGTPVMPRKFARLLFDHGWLNVENLPKMVAVCMAESDLYTHAFHWNDPAEGGDGSTDWGVFQLNDGNKGGNAPQTGVDGKPIAAPKVAAFAFKACDPEQAVLIARDLYNRRGFQPWAAYGKSRYMSKLDDATYAVRNMLHEMWGIKLA